MKDKVKFNIKNVYIAPMKADGETTEWDAPIKVPGAVSLVLDPQGDVKPFYADGITYYQSTANNGYSGDLEVALFPREVLTAIWKMVEGKTSKVLVENAKDEPLSFALLFEEDGDKSGTKYVLYNCTGTRPKRTFSTNTEGKEVQTQTSTISSAPLENGSVMAMTQEDTPKTVLDEWYKKVYVETGEQNE